MTDEEFDLQAPFDDDSVEIDLDEINAVDDEDQTVVSSPRRPFDRRLLLVGFVVLAVLCLVGAIIFRIYTDGRQDQVEEPSATATQVAAQPSPTAAEETEPEEATPAPTQVIEEPTTAPTEAAPTVFPTSTPLAVQPSPTPVPPTATPVGEQLPVSDIGVGPGPIENLLQNAGFETGTKANWGHFATGEATITFSSESTGPLVNSGDAALRISIDRTTRPDRYGGIYQTVEVVPGQPYTLELNGQIRSKPRDTIYNYRMQYAVDYSGGTDWQAVPAEDWVELPWDEQDIAAAHSQFNTYTTVITPTERQLTMFVRGWHKWADLSLAEFTLDDLSLTGASPVAVEPPLMAESPAPADEQPPATDEQLIPVTGDDGLAGLLVDARFWGAMLILLLLTGGALYRGKWSY